MCLHDHSCQDIFLSHLKKKSVPHCKWYWVSMGHFGGNFEGITYLHPKENKGSGFQGSLLNLGQ